MRNQRIDLVEFFDLLWLMNNSEEIVLERAAPEGIEPPMPSLELKKNRLKNFWFESTVVSQRPMESVG